MLRYKEIKLQLKEMIAKIPANEKIPSRAVLCQELDTTRSTLAKAIKELETEGLLVSKGGSGTYVSMLFENEAKLSGNWGVIVPNIMDSIYPGLVRGVENIAQEFGINVNLCNSDNDSEKQEQYIKRLMISGVSGFIIVPVITNDYNENYHLYQQLSDSKIPFVFCNRGIEGIDAPIVTSNSFYGGYIATKYLLNHGYKKIAFVAKQKYSTSLERCYGYVSALIEAGKMVRDEFIIMNCDKTEELRGFREIKLLLENEDRPDAIFCFNDELVKTVYNVMNEMGLQVSTDVGIIGYDNVDLCGMLLPPSTSVAYKIVEIGEKAAEVLKQMMQKQPISQFNYSLFQPEIIERESCKGKNI